MNYYSILQLDENATQDEIKQAYHRMARLFHPDNFKGSQEDAAEQMSKVNEAYQTLSDIDKRAAYDAELKLKRGKSSYDGDRWDTTNNNSSRYSGTTTSSANESASATPKDDYVNANNQGMPVRNGGKTQKGCSSCLAKIIEWAIYIGIIYFLVSHFHLVDKVKSLFNSSEYSTGIETEDQQTQLKPEEVVGSYLKYMREGKVDKANALFSADADENFQSFTVAEYNQAIVDLYYGFEDDIPTYPLFEEIRDFEYAVGGAEIDKKEESAEVSAEIQNCDIALLFGMILEADGDENILETLSDSELQKLFRKAIKKYREPCLISTDAKFALIKDQEGYWKIDSISPLKDFSTVMIGQADDLILIINGEETDDDTSDEEEDYDEDYEDEDYEEDSDLLW
jgi:curved DNA-binding protein CbpA